MTASDERDAFDRGYLTAKVELLERKLDSIETKVDGLTTWRAWVLGAAAAVSAFVSFLVPAVLGWFKRGGGG